MKCKVDFMRTGSGHSGRRLHAGRGREAKVRWPVAVALGASLLALPLSAATAQLYPGSEIYREFQETDHAVRQLHKFAQCTAVRRRSTISFLEAEPGSKLEQRRGSTLVEDDCVDDYGALRFPFSLLRGALYEALYKAQAQPQLVPEAVAPLTYPYASSDVNEEQRLRHKAKFFLGECVVRADAPQAVALLGTAPATPGEAAAFKPLAAHLSACLPQGVQLSFSRPVLRGIIAEAVYRLSTAPRRPVASAGK